MKFRKDYSNQKIGPMEEINNFACFGGSCAYLASNNFDISLCLSPQKEIKDPALDHPALEIHTIQMRPSYCIPVSDSIKKNNSSSRITHLHIWRRGGSCPKGTIPIRRVKKQNLLRFNDLERFGTKHPQIVNSSNKRRGFCDRTVVINNANCQYWPSRQSFCLNVWNPRVRSPDDYMTAQLWPLGGAGSHICRFGEEVEVVLREPFPFVESRSRTY